MGFAITIPDWFLAHVLSFDTSQGWAAWEGWGEQLFKSRQRLVLSRNFIEYFQSSEVGVFIFICEIIVTHGNLTLCQCQIATHAFPDIVGE